MKTRKKTVAKRPNTKAPVVQTWEVYLCNGDFIATFQETRESIQNLFKGASVGEKTVFLA